MRVDVGAPFRQRVDQALSDPDLRIALDRATDRLATRRAEAMAAVDSETLRGVARSIREHAVRHLPDLLEELEQNLTANGVHVHWARDAEEATAIVRHIAHQTGSRRVVKSKSMVTEEIHLNAALEADGIRVTETDLGEYIIQLAGEPPSHIIAPVIHKRIEEVRDLFQARLGMPPTDDPQEMCRTARETLRGEFLGADMGISGCNFAVAETGTICIVTNEGNGRMVTSVPPVYVAVAGIEKVVPRLEDAFHLWQAAARSATGQGVSVYFSLSSGPRAPGHADGPEEMHVVLLDNGRSRILERDYADALLCIRCGACLNACPVYRAIGGHAYGRTPYNGPIGAVLTPLLADDPSSAAALPYASTLCGACRDACPVQIDLPRLLLDLRSDLVARGATPRWQRSGLGWFSRSARHPKRYERLLTLGRRLVNGLAFGRASISWLPPPLSRWTASRRFPRFAARPFRFWWRSRPPSADS